MSDGLAVPTAVYVVFMVVAALVLMAMLVAPVVLAVRRWRAAASRRQRTVSRALLVDRAQRPSAAPVDGHPKGCTCLPCWERYVRGLFAEDPWDRRAVLRQRKPSAGAR